jgi:phospholipid/cholesterol/gamma-HCH transport system substrate-binding protein
MAKDPGTYSDGDTIPGRLAESLMDKIDSEIIPVKDKISNLIVVLDSVISSVDDVMNPEFKKNFSGTLAHLNSTTASLDKVLGSKEKSLLPQLII